MAPHQFNVGTLSLVNLPYLASRRSLLKLVILLFLVSVLYLASGVLYLCKYRVTYKHHVTTLQACSTLPVHCIFQCTVFCRQLCIASLQNLVSVSYLAYVLYLVSLLCLVYCTLPSIVHCSSQCTLSYQCFEPASILYLASVLGRTNFSPHRLHWVESRAET